MVSKIAEALAPVLVDRLRAGISAFQQDKRKQRHLFVLKAITTEDGQLVAPRPGEMRYDLWSIDRRIYIAQMREAMGEEWVLPLWEDRATPEQQKHYDAAIKRQTKLGLPAPNDADRAAKMERILHEMVEDDKLAFHPPNMWMVR